jgi:hypothetical protein
VQNAFVIVVIAVGVVGVLGGLISVTSSRRAWEELGRDHLHLDSDAAPPTPPSPALSPGARAERDSEIRQMLLAGNARRRRRGQPELDVEAEVARLLGGGLAGPGEPAVADPGAGDPGAGDPELTAEVRQLVIARNHRRARRGEPPLDVEAEVARELARLKG